jgi:hypothetical protein
VSPLTGDREFESTSLQRRVTCEPDFLFLARQRLNRSNHSLITAAARLMLGIAERWMEDAEFYRRVADIRAWLER